MTDPMVEKVAIAQQLRNLSATLVRNDDAAVTWTAADTIEKLVALLRRYRSETPLGNQPHRIAGEVDELLAKLGGAS